jgi:hypothetical protein
MRGMYRSTVVTVLSLIYGHTNELMAGEWEIARDIRIEGEVTRKRFVKA